jgi:hypothetical protein
METLPRFGPRAIRIAIAASIALHLAAAVPFALRRHARSTHVAPPIESAEPPDVWVGKSPFVGGDKLVDVDTSPAPAPAPVPAPAPAPVPAPEPAPEPAAAPEPEPVTAPAPAPAPKKARPTPQQQKAEPRRAPALPKPTASALAGGDAAGGDEGGVHAGAFGSEGKAGVRSVGRAFTRAIPPACQGDSGWGSIAAGATFKAELILFIDAAGHVERTAFAERDVPAPIKEIVKRTLPLIESNTLSVRGGAVVRGSERLRLKVSVSDAAGRASDELDFPFFENGRGKASFTQPSGKHVEVEVQVTKVLVASD